MATSTRLRKVRSDHHRQNDRFTRLSSAGSTKVSLRNPCLCPADRVHDIPGDAASAMRSIRVRDRPSRTVSDALSPGRRNRRDGGRRARPQHDRFRANQPPSSTPRCRRHPVGYRGAKGARNLCRQVLQHAHTPGGVISNDVHLGLLRSQPSRFGSVQDVVLLDQQQAGQASKQDRDIWHRYNCECLGGVLAPRRYAHEAVSRRPGAQIRDVRDGTSASSPAAADVKSSSRTAEPHKQVHRRPVHRSRQAAEGEREIGVHEIPIACGLPRRASWAVLLQCACTLQANCAPTRGEGVHHVALPRVGGVVRGLMKRGG
ncbi:hypothetical protein PybrP1_006377 [[Pythium] brassicae (nom. inval.)]|nr:hypothetical protein PybrP1_006377 [[Pythium] brassicae (nom. inval.)]